MGEMEQATRAGPGLSLGVKIILGTAAAAFLAACAWLAWATPVLAPYSDMLDWVARYLDFRTNHDLGAYLLTQHVIHRPVFTFLILWADAALFGAHGGLFVITGVGLLVATAILLARTARDSAHGDVSWVIAAAAAALVLLPSSFLDATLHIYTVYIEALFLCVAAILLASPAGQEAPSPGRLALALACAAAAAFGNGVALAVLPVLAFSAWRRNRMLGQMILVGGILFGLAYFASPTGAGAVAAPPASGHGVTSIGLMFFSYLGLPWATAVPRLGWVLGLVLAGLSGWAILKRGGVEASRTDRVAVQFIQFSLITAAMAAVGRIGAALPSEAPLRYAVLLAPLHVGLLMLAAPTLQSFLARRPREAQALLVAVAIVVVLHQVAAGVFIVRTADINRARVLAFKAGDRSAPVLAVMYPDATKAEALLVRMRAEGVYQGD